MERKKRKINYLIKEFKKDKEGIVEIVWASKIVEGSYSKRYANTISLIVKLSPSSNVLLNFILEEMDERNYIGNTKVLKERLNKLLQDSGLKTYTSNTINKSFSELHEFKILLRPLKKSRGLYQVNPEYFFNGTEKEREKAIRTYLEDRNRKMVNTYRRNEYLKESKLNNHSDQPEDFLEE